jgi:hypothetical protein
VHEIQKEAGEKASRRKLGGIVQGSVETIVAGAWEIMVAWAGEIMVVGAGSEPAPTTMMI